MKQKDTTVAFQGLDYEAIGIRIRTIRNLQQLQQQELAFMADIDPGYLSKVERGEKHPSLDVITRIAVALKVSLDDLVFEQPQGFLTETQRKIRKHVANSDQDALNWYLALMEASEKYLHKDK